MVDKTRMHKNHKDEISEDYLGNYPIDSMLIRQQTRTVFEVIRRINRKAPDHTKFILDPDFQRGFVWNLTLQSRFIESCLMRIPIPVFYFAEKENGDTVVVDGLQRLTTFKRYLSNRFYLFNLSENSPLEGKRFRDLSPKLQNRLEDTQLILYLIDPKVPEQAKLDIFERVNSGRPLTRQQMRNALHNGQATIWLRQQSENKLFLTITGFNERKWQRKQMLDREAINRFCAFTLLGIKKYQGTMDHFLADALTFMNNMENNQLIDLSTKFQQSMENNHLIFGEYAFQIPIKDADGLRFNMSYFDVFSVILANLSKETVKSNLPKLNYSFKNLRQDRKFREATTFYMTKSNKKKYVQQRFDLAHKALYKVIR